MNYSSVLITVLPEHQEELLRNLEDSELCEVYLYEEGKIIVIIEGQNTDEEINKLRQIEAIENVLSANMIFSYVEDDINELRQHLEMSGDVPEILIDEKVKAEDIKYGGDLTKKF